MMATDGYDVRWKYHVEEVFVEVKKLRTKDNFSDVIVHCGGRNFLAHKIILAASSRFFERVLASVPRDRCQVLVMAETSPDLLELLMSFIYEGEAYVSADDFDNFMTVAEKLEIRGLNSGCHRSVPALVSRDKRSGAAKRQSTSVTPSAPKSENVLAQAPKRRKTAVESADKPSDVKLNRISVSSEDVSTFLPP
jgi:hypothetical protein